MVRVENEVDVTFDELKFEDASLLLFLLLEGMPARFPTLVLSVANAEVTGLRGLCGKCCSSLFISTSIESEVEVIVLCLLKFGKF